MKKVLVTGADGFIGSHLTEELLRRGYGVRAFVFYNSFNSWGWLDESTDDIKSSLDVFAGDIRDRAGVASPDVDAWTFIFLVLVLKIPVVLLLGIVWWAVNATPETAIERAIATGSAIPPSLIEPITEGDTEFEFVNEVRGGYSAVGT